MTATLRRPRLFVEKTPSKGIYIAVGHANKKLEEVGLKVKDSPLAPTQQLWKQTLFAFAEEQHSCKKKHDHAILDNRDNLELHINGQHL